MNTLVAVDIASDPAPLVEHAVAWARSAGAELHLRFAAVTPDPAHTATLEALLATVPEPMRGTAQVVPGALPESLVREAARFDVVLLGVRGQRAASRNFLGPIAEALLRDSTRPVVVLRTDGRRVESGSRLQVLVPVDAEDPHIRAALAAHSWFGGDTQIHLVYALPDLRMHSTAGLVSPFAGAGDHPLREWAEGRLHDLMDAYSLDLALHFVARTHENPAADLASFADVVGAHVIALPTRGRSGTGLGPVVERLARLSPCPVMVVR